MEFRVLGPLEIRGADGEPRVVAAPKQKALLALLLVHRNQVVSVDRLIDEPKLRDVLDPDRSRGVLVTSPPGYMLHVADENLDAARFERSLIEARRLLPQDPHRARDLLEEALGLWRGPPFDDVGYESFIQSETRRLGELHLAALAERIEADLALGAHEQLIGELEALVTEHPLQERFWGQLMVALYRSGRQPEALRAYQRAHRAFGELGTEPSEELKQLEKQVLLRDPTLEIPTPDTRVEGNLPQALSSFVGRQTDIETVTELIAEHRLVTLVGPGGVGKTRLAIETARGLTNQYPAGVWLIRLAALEHGKLVPRQIAGLSEGPDGDLPDSLAIYLRRRTLLLVLDNCEQVAESVAQLAAELLTRCPALHLLVTSRRVLGVEGETTHHTQPLPIDGEGDGPAGAVELFLDRARTAQPSMTVTAETRLLATGVCRRLAGLPLAIELAAARLRMMSLPQLSERLDDTLELLTGGPTTTAEHHHALGAALDWSHRLLDPPEQDLFRRLAVFRGGFTLPTAEQFHHALGMKGSALQQVGQLVDASMIQATPHDRYLMLEPIRHYALQHLREKGEETTARNTHATVYRDLFRVPDSVLLNLEASLPGIQERFFNEMDNVRAALEWALETGDTTTAIELGGTAAILFHRWGQYADAKRWVDRVLAIRSVATPRRARVLAFACFLGGLSAGPDRAEEIADELAAVAEALDDDEWRALSVERGSVVGWLRDDLETASRVLREAADRWLELDHPQAFMSLNNLSVMLYLAGHFQQADAAMAKCIEVANRFGLPGMVEWKLVDRGLIAALAGEPDTAEQYLDQADALPRESEEIWPYNPAYGSMIRGFIALLRGDWERAEALGTPAISDPREMSHPEMQFPALVLVGLTHFHRGDIATADRYFTEALQQADRLGSTVFTRWVLGPHAVTLALLDPVGGATLLAAVEANNRRDGRRPPFPLAEVMAEANRFLEQSLPAGELERARTRGAAMTVDDAIEFALEADGSLSPSRSRNG
jgi:predicted ATPase/DNA-binding SARP family transcriptional activator